MDNEKIKGKMNMGNEKIKGKMNMDNEKIKGKMNMENALLIVILQRGWVVVGRVTRSDNQLIITEASVVRRWGTTSGLGEIAMNGPTANTILDKCGTVRVHELAVVATMDCVEAKWTL